MKIAVGGILHETNTFSTVPTRYEDFRRIEEGELRAALARTGVPTGVEVVPLFVAHATPSGRVTKTAFDRMLLELADGLRKAMPLDGALLELHGAMEVEEIGDGETAILEAVRNLIGPSPLVCVTLDLHANLAPEVVEFSDIVLAYRTAPHRDAAETRARGLRLLTQSLAAVAGGDVRPVTRMVKLPLLVAGEAAVTEVEPARGLFARLPAVDAERGVLCSSILIGCAWTDSPYTTVSTVVSGTEAAAVDAAAVALARAVWDARDGFSIDSPTAELSEAVRIALARPERPVFISDSGDNTTAGAAGDLPTVLRYLVEQDVGGSLVAGIHDPEAVKQCAAAGVGAEVELVIGARLDSVHDSPYSCTATVVSLAAEVESIPPRAHIRVGPVDAVLQSNRRPFTELRHFRLIGLDPANFKLIFVKEGYLFPELRDYASFHIMALTPGFGDQRLERLPFEQLPRPIHPLDEGVTWTEAR